MNKAIFLMGLPNSGKTSWANDNINHTLYTKVSADDLKENHKDYNPNDTFPLHEWSVAEAENTIEKLSDLNQNILVDSGSINNRYTIRIIKMLKGKGYSIKLIHIKTPYRVCLERNKLRERKVPEAAITDKALKETSQFHKLEQLVDDILVVDYYTNKNIFIDMDGVIAAQSTLPKVNGCIDFVNGEVFKWLKPVTPTIAILNKLKDKGYKLRILSATPNSFSIDEKHEWLDKHFNLPREDRFFVNSGKHKAEMLDNLRRKFKLDKKDILLIDDFHATLEQVEERGMNAMHISEFLITDWKLNI